MINIKTDAELDAMRESGAVAATVLKLMASQVAPGITTRELDEYARDRMADLGCKSAFLGYRGYPGYTCISINNEVVHGIPGDRKVVLGDIVSIDVGVEYRGFIGDNATTVMVGVTDPEIIRLVKLTQDSLAAAIEMAVEGKRLSDISNAVQKVVEPAGFTVVRDFVGHGIGRTMHEEPQIPNFGPPGRGPKLKPGMTFAIEPMVNMGKADVEIMEDGWTVLTRDRLPSVHFEHTVAVGVEKAEILTIPRNV